MKSWVEKYRPNSFSEIVGQKEVIERLNDFIKNYKYQRRKAILLHGPAGVGKTTLALVAAKETDSEIFELNASDFRNKIQLQEKLKPVLEQQSLLKKRKLILIDEVDGISAIDRGGLPELIRLIELTTYPIIITANDVYKKSLSSITKKVELLEIKQANYSQIKDRLIKVLEKEDKFIDGNVLTKISIKANGDIRAAINDLQSAASMENPEEIILGERNKQISIFEALKLVLKGKPMPETIGVFDNVKEPIDEIILWMEKNVPLEYKEEELKNAFEKISRTDIFKGRIHKQQYWRFLVYENFLLSYGISASKKNPKLGFTSYKRPTRILKIWMANQKYAKRKTIAEKYAKLVHIGTKRAIQEFNWIKPILQNTQVQKQLRLTKEEISYLN
jgi:replication factor C large subunit